MGSQCEVLTFLRDVSVTSACQFYPFSVTAVKICLGIPGACTSYNQRKGQKWWSGCMQSIPPQHQRSYFITNERNDPLSPFTWK